jgi:hypothetical protein
MKRFLDLFSVLIGYFTRSYLSWFLVYFGVILALRLLSNGVGALINWSSVFLLLGGVVGLMIELVDRWVYVYFSHPEEPLSVQLKGLVKENRYADAMTNLMANFAWQQRLSMNNVLFLGGWVVLAIFLMTSSVSAFAHGLVLGIGLSLLGGIWRDWKNPEVLKTRLFWPIKRKVAGDEMKAVVGVFVGAFLLVSLMAV